ncbi:hypothetical protein BofuT4_uP019910.1 [Botrytis cinerea T4]|uniref:Secreted protein n=1 Tax=Botryotinia fuckeliana (strain T4) TaxID=999810 RepID=G2YIZ8_BOTF4|nr:hypothetical protein BofuT4_uP019910.1 [Botrytis cinerea T4]
MPCFVFLLVRHAVGISIGLGYNAVVNPSLAPNINVVSPANQMNQASEWMTAQSREQQAKCTVIGSKGRRETVVLASNGMPPPFSREKTFSLFLRAKK